MNLVHLFTSFEGRITRQPFWIAWVVLIVVQIAIAVAEGDDSTRWGTVLDLLLIYPQFAVCAKRGHDRNTSTWVIGLFFAIGAAFDLLLLGGWIDIADLTKPTPLVLAFFVPYGVFALALIIDLGFRRGTMGPNRYGPDPLEAGA